MEIAIVGVGAIGSVIAGALHRAGLAPHLVVRRPFDALELRCSSPEGQLRWAQPPQWRKLEEAVAVDLLFVATKAHQTESAQAWLSALTRPDTTVVVVQNGIEHEARVRPYVGEATVLPAIIDVPATRRAPGEVELRRGGKLSLPDRPEARAVEACFVDVDPWLEVERRSDLAAVMWRKLCVNVISGAIPTLTDRPAGVFRDPAIQEVARALIAEAMAVAAAEGITLPDDLPDQLIAGFASSPPDAVNSMLMDRRAGRRLEADARHGAVVRHAARHDLHTPYNHLALALLDAINA